ncbi:MAG: iron-sulfur cluster biosynthesis family protein [Trichococcus sp.]|nr:iron-sulfur cluster biosynthesis family protein [Trichococcus sp.]MBP9976467.1 iron-sulfur cluster biosynthesis family protein [Trichococcus sp.]
MVSFTDSAITEIQKYYNFKNIGPVPAQKWALVFLDSDNVIDFNADQHAFQLKSERGFLNMNLLLEQTVAQ